MVEFRTLIRQNPVAEQISRSRYTVYGFNSSVNNFINGVLFPGDLRDCAKCHVKSLVPAAYQSIRYVFARDDAAQLHQPDHADGNTVLRIVS